MNKNISLPVTFSVNNEVSAEDTRFLNIEIDVLHTGENLNGSVFDKEVVDECIDSIKNTPVLGFIKYDKVTQENDFCGHEYILTRTENGIEEKYIGSAYGIVPESCNPRWVIKTADDGQEREYLRVDAVLWTKFSDSVNIMERDVEKSESMELNIDSIDGYEDEETGLFHFTKFSFDGLCLLGEGVEPAMIGANATIKEVQFTLNDFIRSVQSELNYKYSTFTNLMVDEKNNQGGKETMQNTDFTQTVLEQFSDLSAIVSQYETIQNRWGENMPRYYLQDIQDDEVIVVDCKDNYHYYGFRFTVNGDKPEIDFACGTRKKVRYENYEDGTTAHESAFDFGKYISDIEEKAFTKVNDANAKVEAAEQAKADAEANYTTIKADYDEIKPKYDEYVIADEQRQKNELNAQKDAKFAEYEDVLAENADFVALKERKDEMSVDEIDKECAVLYVHMNRGKNNFSKSNGTSGTVGIIDDNDDDDKGYVLTKYGNIPVRR